MRKLTSLALLAAIPLGVAAFLRGRRAVQTPGEKRRRIFERVGHRLRRQAGELGESIREAMPDLPVIGHRN